jgi:hypothetical protein
MGVMDLMADSDKTAATELVLRVSGFLLGLSLLLVFMLAVLAGFLYAFTGVSVVAVVVLAGAGLALAASGLHAMRSLARLSGLGYCGFWDHCAAVRLLYRQTLALVVVSFMAALAIWMA